MTPLKLKKDDYISKNGWLSPWGTIKILRSHANVPDTEWKGPEYWSETFAQFRKESYHTRLADNQSGIWIIDEQGNEGPLIPCEDIYFVISRRFRVHSVHPSLAYLFREDEPSSNLERCLRALAEVACGRKPSHIDSEPFLQVPFEFNGEILMVVDFDSSDRRLVFTEAGDSVNYEIAYPLKGGSDGQTESGSGQDDSRPVGESHRPAEALQQTGLPSVRS